MGIGKARLRFAFNQFHGQKCFFACERYFKTKYNSEQIRSSGKFSRGKDRQKWITSETTASRLKKSFKLRFQYWIYLKWMISPLSVIGIFIFCCSQSKNGFTNAKIQSSLAISKKSCNNLIFSVHFLNCQYQQHLQSAPFNTETGSHPHFLTSKWTVLTSSWMHWYDLLS